MTEFRLIICVMIILTMMSFIFACRNGSEDRFMYNLYGNYVYNKDEADDLFYDIEDALEKFY